MQHKILIDGLELRQPDVFEPDWETTYAEDSGRVQSGKASTDPLYTVEAFKYEVSNLSVEDAYFILRSILARPDKPTFRLHYFSWYYGEWRDDEFYVGKGSLKCQTLEEDKERLSSLSCNMIGVNPLV